MSLYSKIENLLNANRITKNELEVKLELGRGIISGWKVSSPSTDKLLKVADYFNVSIDYLLGRTDDPQVNYVRSTSSAKMIELNQLIKISDFTDRQAEIVMNYIDGALNFCEKRVEK